jgi:hypothetical protein
MGRITCREFIRYSRILNPLYVLDAGPPQGKARRTDEGDDVEHPEVAEGLHPHKTLVLNMANFL